VTSYRYLIVGGGMTGDAACKGIRSIDPDGSIALVGDEPDPPYARPPLTKGLWLGKEESSIWRGTEDEGVDLHLGRTIVSLDLDARTATDDRGDTYGYDRLLLATGGRPRHLPGAPEGVVHYRTLADYHTLRAAAAEGTRVAVIGGGFIGSELAAALASNGCAVTMIFPEEAIGTRLFPRDLALSLNDYYREKGVELVAGGLVGGVERRDGGYRVTVDGGGAFDADVVVAGLGIVPRDELAADSGMATDNGIPVDDRGRVAGHDDVFAAGDVARFPVAALGGTMRVEHEDHAKSHGRLIGANMAGADEPYDHLPFFYSDLFDLGYEAVGELDSRLRTTADWTDVGGAGTVYYLDEEGRPRGVLLWNLFGRVDTARELIRTAKPIPTAELVG